MLPLEVSKVRDTYILLLVDVSIRFSVLLDFVLKAFSEVDIHFIYSNLLLFYCEKPDVNAGHVVVRTLL